MHKLTQIDRNELKLLPCPFCGGPAGNVGFAYITCLAAMQDECVGKKIRLVIEDNDEQAAIKAWNTRAKTHQAAHYEELVSYLKRAWTYLDDYSSEPDPGISDDDLRCLNTFIIEVADLLNQITPTKSEDK